MKTLVSLIGIIFLFIAPVYSELSPPDLDKIRLIVKEENSISETNLNQRMDGLEAEFKDEMANSERRTQVYVDTKIDALQKQINLLIAFVSGLIILMVATIGIPQIIMAWRGKDERSQDEKIEALSREIEALKEQRIINP